MRGLLTQEGLPGRTPVPVVGDDGGPVGAGSRVLDRFADTLTSTMRYSPESFVQKPLREKEHPIPLRLLSVDRGEQCEPHAGEAGH